ncbi:C2 family cysteine protease [Luteimonas aquatica]|uniref:C2 family cysteine protease n=1 Tax=Luteimonas aquatica TaxID=450364 RepID=UPI001F5A6CAB|nr:C2 family cysteine protease [Luteimonas aquatica]
MSSLEAPRLAPPARPIDDRGWDKIDKQPVQTQDTPFVTGNGDGNAVDPNDVRQNGYGSCGVMSTLEAIAQQDPSVIQDMIQDNGDGTYTVTFQDRVSVFGQDIWVPREVTVSGPFGGGAAHPSGDVNSQGEQEIWPSIIEAAYAQAYKPNDPTYTPNPNVPGSGGVFPSDAMEHILGARATTAAPGAVSFSQMEQMLDGGQAVVAWTGDSKGFTPQQQALANQYNVQGGHAYAVSDVIPAGTTYTDPNTGQQAVAAVDTVVLDNPWGNQDVVMPYSDYQAMYAQVSNTPTH